MMKLVSMWMKEVVVVAQHRSLVVVELEEHRRGQCVL